MCRIPEAAANRGTGSRNALAYLPYSAWVDIMACNLYQGRPQNARRRRLPGT